MIKINIIFFYIMLFINNSYYTISFSDIIGKLTREYQKVSDPIGNVNKIVEDGKEKFSYKKK